MGRWLDSLTWRDWSNFGGLLLAIAGIGLTLWQVKKARSASEAALKAVESTRTQVVSGQLLLLVPQLRWIAGELDDALHSRSSPAAKKQLDNWRWQASNIHGILSSDEAPDSSLLTTIQQSVALASTAGGLLLTELDQDPMRACKKAREKAWVVCDALSSWSGTYAASASSGEGAAV